MSDGSVVLRIGHGVLCAQGSFIWSINAELGVYFVDEAEPPMKHEVIRICDAACTHGQG